MDTETEKLQVRNSSPSRTSRVVLKYRRSSILTWVAAIIGFVLGLIALLATAKNGKLADYNIMTLNTSTILQNAIKIESAGASSTANAKRDILELPQRTIGVRIPDPTPAVVLEERTVVEVRQLGISAASSFFASVASNFPTPTIPSLASATASGTVGGELVGGLESILGNLAGNLTSAVGGELIQGVNALVKEVTKAIGIKEWYGLYMMQYCEGNYVPSYSDPNARVNITKCQPLMDASLLNGNNTNSTLRVGNAVVDFSALNIVNKLNSTSGSLKSLLLAFIVFQIIGIVCCGLLILATPLYLLLPFLQNRPVRIVIAFLVSLGAMSYLLTAGIVTGVATVAAGALDQLAGDLGVDAKKSSAELAILWVSAVFMAIAQGFWFTEWHMNTFARRSQFI
ncbi:hypothetical protein B0J14DRAFT_590590 [Halenospora varia]|nr:hypothetical protein B0J14DRAFT_590590 [Halenospora varia]